METDLVTDVLGMANERRSGPNSAAVQSPLHRSKAADVVRKSPKLCTDVVADMSAERLIDWLVEDETGSRT